MGCVVSVFAVEPFRIGGTEAFARELSKQLGELGWTSVLCFLTEPTAEVRDFLGLPNVMIEVTPAADKNSLQSIRNMSRILSNYRPRILHLHFLGFLNCYPWLAHLHGVDQVFFTDHSSRPRGYAPHPAPIWKRKVVQAINRPLDRVICVSEYGLNCMTSLKVLPRERYQLVYNGVDLARIHPDEKRGKAFRQRFAIPDDRAIVLQVSWIIPEKGIEEVLRTAQKVIAANDKVQFVLAGEGPQRQSYMELAAELGLSDHITWTGLLNDPLDDGVYEAADIIIQLSNWEEVFGWMIAEGMAFGKPVVATRVGGIPELVADGRSGFLIERGDVAQAAEKILALLSDSSLREALGQAGREKTGTSFDLRKNVTLLLHSYGLKPKLP